MKKTLILLTAIILVFAAFSPFYVYAEAVDARISPETSEEMLSSVLNLLDNALKNRINENLSGDWPQTSYTVEINLKNYKDEPFYIEEEGVSGNSPVITLEIFDILKDNPEYDYEFLIFKGGENEGKYTTFNISYQASAIGKKVVSLTVTYLFTWGESKAETKAVEDYCAEKIAEITTPQMTDYQKIKAIYSFMAKEFSYATEELENNEQGIYFASYFIETKKGVCQAYAALFLKMMEAAGLRESVRAVRHDSYSEGVGHAWNLVKLNGSWYHLDITWDDMGKTAGDEYFLKSDKTFKKDHSWRENFYPKANKDYNPNEPESSKPPQSKPVESKPTESKPTESKPVESKPVESKPTESKTSSVASLIPSDENESAKTSTGSLKNELLDYLITVEFDEILKIFILPSAAVLIAVIIITALTERKK